MTPPWKCSVQLFDLSGDGLQVHIIKGFFPGVGPALFRNVSPEVNPLCPVGVQPAGGG